jgi:hypothetical protein
MKGPSIQHILLMCAGIHTQYIIVFDLKPCEVLIYESDLRKISDNFLANNAFFILPDFRWLL